MENNAFTLNNKIFTENNNILLEIISDLQQLKNYTKDDLIIIRIGDIITMINNLINANKKNTELIIKYITDLKKQMNKRFDELKINTINKKELNFHDGRYVGQVLNGIREGKGTMYYNDGDRYEGDWKNGIREGKGIYFFSFGDRYEGDWKNDKKEGKGIMFINDGDRYEGDFKNDIWEGKGVYYYNNGQWKGDRYEGDFRNGIKEGQGVYYHCNGDIQIGYFHNDNGVGIHAMLTKDKEVKSVQN